MKYRKYVLKVPENGTLSWLGWEKIWSWKDRLTRRVCLVPRGEYSDQNRVMYEPPDAYKAYRMVLEETATIRLDGNKWCALIGDDLQSGHAGFEAADTLGALPPQLRPLLTRMTPDAVYDIYTSGYNHGIRVADDNSHEILGTVQQWTESERSPAPKETPP